jgi:hypothetical protein
MLFLYPGNCLVIPAQAIIGGCNIIVQPKALRVRRNLPGDLLNSHFVKEGRVARKATR